MQEKRTRGSGRKKAPEGFYTAQQAMARLGLNKSTFYHYVSIGKIEKYLPPLRSEGYYAKKEIDQMATEIALYLLTHTEEQSGVQVRTARSREDAEGIVAMLHSFGWQSATVEQYLSWWEVNPLIHVVVTDHDTVMGNIACIPYIPATIEERLAGRKRAWDITPEDIRPYRRGSYDVYMGIEVRQDVPDFRRYAFRLISGFLTFLEELAAQGIIIRRIYGVSAEAPGQKLARDLGFVEQPKEPGDLYDTWKRYMLDLETSDSQFAQQYRKS